MTDLAFATVAELSAGIGNGQLSPVEVVDALLARIARLDGQLHAFVVVHADQARLAAEGAPGPSGPATGSGRSTGSRWPSRTWSSWSGR